MDQSLSLVHFLVVSPRAAYSSDLTTESLAKLAKVLTDPLAAAPAGGVDTVRIVHNVAMGSEPWLLGASGPLNLARRLEADFPTLEEAGCKVGIGVATGADKAFIAPYATLDVEDDRKVPLITTSDIAQGGVNWQGLAVINPFTESGDLVRLANYPRLERYLDAHRKEIAGRHVAQKNPKNWYRTIDRLDTRLTSTPKLLIPDIKGGANIVYEDGHFYPHHNLYYITSADWHLQALQAVLLSGIAFLFVSTYSTKMRGDYLRFQAQYLRRIRIPYWNDIAESIRHELVAAAERGDQETCNRIAYDLYGLTEAEQDALRRS